MTQTVRVRAQKPVKTMMLKLENVNGSFFGALCKQKQGEERECVPTKQKKG